MTAWCGSLENPYEERPPPVGSRTNVQMRSSLHAGERVCVAPPTEGGGEVRLIALSCDHTTTAKLNADFFSTQ